MGVIDRPLRLRSPRHLSHVRTFMCASCKHHPPNTAHHLMHAQPSAMGLKSGDQFAVPLCRKCHDSLHAYGAEKSWWEERGIDPIALAKELWDDSPGRVDEVQPKKLARFPYRRKKRGKG